LGNYDRAIDAYDYAIAIEEGFSSAHFNLGNAYMNKENFDKALDCYLKTLEIEGPSAEIYCHIGAAYEKLNQFDLATKYYRKATKIDQMYHEAWFGLGVSLSLQEKWYEAIHFLDRALQIDSKNGLYWKAKADAEYRTGNIVSAMDAYVEACELDPADVQIWLDWSFVYFEQGDFENALAIVDGGLRELQDNADLMYRSVVYLISQGKYKEAFNRLEMSLVLDFDAHEQLFEFFPNLQTQKALFKIIDQYRKND
ncbi:MAG: tetratricopeptide repeat protein, partial [Cyclobacteriaceae bacterium]|nr:tetratricopeptide repeat protein [Cyclobacteriaceae bacterium HetDA_MAG_MS6]